MGEILAVAALAVVVAVMLGWQSGRRRDKPTNG
jgi:hypothetical protein